MTFCFDIGDRLAARLKKLRDKGSLWKASKPQMQSMMSMLGMLKKAEQRFAESITISVLEMISETNFCKQGKNPR